MSRRVVITGVGPLCGSGIGMDGLWEAICTGRSTVRRIERFDPTGFETRIGAEVHGFDVRRHVPKTYRKATKVMARDIELAVGAADEAARDAGLEAPSATEAAPRHYEGPRTGCHIGAGLIAADVDELTSALAQAVDAEGGFDIHRWGAEGMQNLTPLWLLKYLPNMLACHVTIIHDAQGPSNTITCGEASSGLSIGESMRVIQRGAADMCFCGGAESKLNPMAFYRQVLTGRLVPDGEEASATAVRPFDEAARGTVLGEGGGILTIEALETARQRGARVYAELVGFGASHTVWPEGRGLEPDPDGRELASAIRTALREARVGPDAIDLAIPLGSAIPSYDRAEAAALRAVLGAELDRVEIWSATPFVGNCGAGAGGIALAVAARALREQRVPARIHCDRPIGGLRAAQAETRAAELRHALVFTSSLGGQNVALVVRQFRE